MVTKSRKTSAGKKKKVKVLSLRRETLKDLTAGETKRVKGGGVSAIGAGTSRGANPTAGTQTVGQSCFGQVSVPPIIGQ